MKRNGAARLLCVLFILVPAVFSAAQNQEGNATWYESNTAALHASHARLPLGTRVRVTNLENDKQVIVTITTRMPSMPDRILELSYEPSRILGMASGATPVRIEVLSEGQTAPLAGEPEQDATGIDGASAAFVQTEAEPPPPPPPPPPPVRPAAGGASAAVPAQAAASLPPGMTIRMIINVNGQEQEIAFPAGNGGTSGALSGGRPLAPPRQESRPQMHGGGGAAQSGNAAQGGKAARIIPAMPDPRNGRVYRLQAGAFASTLFAQGCFDRLKTAGFSPAFERNGALYRVVIPGMRAADMPQAAERLGAAGFAEVWVREERQER